MRNIVYLLALISISCASIYQTSKIAGVYTCIKCLGNCELIIYAGGTYIYNTSYELAAQKGNGKWRIENENIFLTSEYKYGVISFNEKRENTDSIKFQIQNEEKDPLGYAMILYSDSQNCSVLLNSEGLGSCRKQSLKSFIISFLGVRYDYSVRDSLANSFSVCIGLKKTNYAYFDNQKWFIKGDTLIDPKNYIWERKR